MLFGDAVGSSGEGESGLDNDLVWLGDLLAVVGAVFYALYTIEIKKLVDPLKQKYGKEFSVSLFFGFVGILNLACMWPFLFILNAIGFEKFTVPTSTTFGYLTLNALLGTVLSDVLWAAAVVRTTPVVATVVLSSEIPLSILANELFSPRTFSWEFYVGCFLVVTSLVVVNIKSRQLCSRGSN
uniref:EamA domain-containing protein n=2 Tax=Palpitomonas bilix TaxID=652834 RepID=A0A7S3DLE1_9EUKA|mmetsp:Transcript_42256/g.108806  ORF Transcript_42256/g.108806 Transcript_42256/m.108806 type:complete len:183 (+) Transcript_42256:733-1281(+)